MIGYIESELIDEKIQSEEDLDFRVPDQELRLLEDNAGRNLEDNEENKRLLE